MNSRAEKAMATLADLSGPIYFVRRDKGKVVSEKKAKRLKAKNIQISIMVLGTRAYDALQKVKQQNMDEVADLEETLEHRASELQAQQQVIYSYQEEVEALKRQLLDASRAMHNAHGSMFGQALSNPITNFQGKQIDCTEFNILASVARDIDNLLIKTSAVKEGSTLPVFGAPQEAPAPQPAIALPIHLISHRTEWIEALRALSSPKIRRTTKDRTQFNLLRLDMEEMYKDLDRILQDDLGEAEEISVEVSAPGCMLS